MALNAAIMFAVVKGIELAAKAIDNYVHSNEIAISKASELKSTLESNISTINEHQSSLDSLSDRFTELSKGVDDYGNNVSLTKEQMEEYNGLIKDLIAINPALVKGYDAENQAIIDKNSALSDTIELLERERQLELEKSTSSSNLKTIGEGAVAKRMELLGSDFAGQFGSFDLETVSGQAARFGEEAAKLFNDETVKAFYDYTNSRPLEKMNGKSDWLKTFGLKVSDEDMDLDIEGYLQRNVDTFANHMYEILAKANIDPNSDQTKNLKLFIQEWQTLNKELESIDASYIDEYLQKIPQLKDGYDSLTDSQKSFISGYIRDGFSAFDLQNGSVDVKSSIVNMVESISSDDKVKDAINDLFALSTKDMNVTDYVNQYKAMLESIIAQLNISDTDANRIRFKFSVDTDELSSKYENAIKFAQKKFDGYDPTKFFNSNSINSKEEIDNWLKIAQGANSATEAERLYLEQSKKDIPILSKEEVISSVNSLSEGFESLDKIMSSMKGKNPFDFALLDDKKFKDSFSELGESYTNFIETVSDSPKDIKGAQSAFNDLTTAWIDSKLALNGYTEENTKLIASMLKNMGVANSEEVVASRLAFTQEHLAAQKAYTAEMSDTLANATAGEIPGLIDEATHSDIAKVALAGLALEKANANGTILDTSGDIENAIALINTIGSATSALVAYNKAKAGDIFDANTQKANLENLLSQRTGLGMSMELDNQFNAYQEKMDTLKADVDKQVQEAINTSRNYQGKGASANYAGANKTNKAGSDKKKKEETEKEIDWIARRTKAVKDSYAELEELANNNTIAYLGLTQGEFDQAKLIFDNGLGNTAEGLSQLQSYADKAGLSLGELYTMIQSGAPSASKENALQSMLQMQTETLLPQYQREVEAYSKAYADALKAIPSEYKDKIENGGVDIESLPSDLAEKVQKAIDANERLKASEKQLANGEAEHIEKIKELHENRIAAIDIENEKLQQSNKIIKSQMELMEARGEIIGADFYKRQINNNKGLISGNQQNIAEWESEMADLRAAKVDTNSKEYKELKAKVRAAKNEIQGMKLEQEEFNQTLKQMPIDHLSTMISMYGDITAKIENWGTVHTATGKKLNAEYYQTLISNGTTVIGQYEKQIREIKSLMSEYQKGSTVWQELYNQLQDIDSATSSMLTNLQKWNEELLKMPLDNINTYSDSLQKVITGLNGVKSELDSATSAITTAISDRIDLLEKEQKIAADVHQAEIDALQEKADLLEKTNEKMKLQMSLEQAEYNLARSLSQKVNKEIRNGEEVYVEDYDAVRKAKEDKIDAQFNIDKYNLQQQIEDAKTALDDLNDGYQKQIEALEEISKKYSEISTAAEKISNANLATSLFGEGWADKILSGNSEEIYDTLTSLYQTNAEQLEQYQKQADSTANIQTLIENYIDSYKAGTITYEQAMTKINGLLSQMNESMSAMDNLQNIYDYLGTINGVGADPDSILKGIKDGLSITADELVKSLEQYNKNAGMISEHTSSWEQLTNNVSSMLDVLKQVRDNLRNALDDYDSDDDDEPYDKSRGKGWGTGDVNNGPGVFADGIKNGLVGKSTDSEREKMLKHLATNNLKPGEVPILAHEGEAIFNDEQQNNLLKNLASANSFKPNIPDYSSFLNQITVRESTPKQEFKFGNINIQECNSANDLAKEILNGGLTRAVIQGLGKR